MRLTTSSEGVLSDNNDLMGLTVNDGSTDLTVSPTFDLFKYIYTASVPYVVETVTVTATPEDDGASVSFGTPTGLHWTTRTARRTDSRWRWTWAATPSTCR